MRPFAAKLDASPPRCGEFDAAGIGVAAMASACHRDLLAPPTLPRDAGEGFMASHPESNGRDVAADLDSSPGRSDAAGIA